jgi:hypothetical protein
MNMSKAGFGKWTLLDDDTMLPHNLARHSLTSFSIGYSKVSSLASEANAILNDESFAFPIDSNILKENDEERKALIADKINESEIVLDMSASLAVSRYVANDEKFDTKRLFSCFLNPRGTQLVFLAEDKKKEYKLDFLEVSYYRELVYNKELENHFQLDGSGIRYSTSCRDVSNKIPQDNVALFSAICSKAFKEAVLTIKESAIIWELSGTELSVKKHSITLGKCFEKEIDGWTIVYDEWFLKKINLLRKQKLPKETGGVLIGSYDIERKKIFLSDTIIPADNSEYPTSFYRGIGGLKEELERVRRITSNMLTYIGEWHSHPKGCSVSPSNDDLLLLSWLSENMSLEGLPAVMVILGDNSNFSICFATSNQK